MENMSGAQHTKIIEARTANPNISTEESIEHAKTGGKVTQILVTLTSRVHSSLKEYAEIEGTNVDDAAHSLIGEGLSEKGFLEE